VFVTVARRSAAAAGKAAAGRGASRGRKSRVSAAAEDAPVLPSLDHLSLQSVDTLSALVPVESQSTTSTFDGQDMPAVSVLSSSLELGASVEVKASVKVQCGPSKSAEPTVLLGKVQNISVHP